MLHYVRFLFYLFSEIYALVVSADSFLFAVILIFNNCIIFDKSFFPQNYIVKAGKSTHPVLTEKLTLDRTNTMFL